MSVTQASHVLVVGGAGYIGSHVVQALLGSGRRVTVFDNLSSGLEENLFTEAAFIGGDILDPAGLNAALAPRPDGASGESRFDAVIHLAALKAAGESMLEPERYAHNNITGTINLLNAMTAAGIGKLVFSSSAAVYGEPQYQPVDEDHPQAPENFYGFTKLEVERLLAWYDSLRGLRSVSLRYFNAAGYDPAGRITGLEQHPSNLLPVIMEVAVGRREQLKIFGNDYDTADGTGVRDYIHVTDLAEAHVQALELLEAGDGSMSLNLGSEAGISVMEMVEAARRITGRDIPARLVERRPGDPARLVASAQRARKILGWSAGRSDVETLVSTSWNAYRKLLG
ncbi:MAG: UDP-glucose 4-epimerase GalE [Spirochaetes bacterium]|jgi:UDP-glucose 4-epimerase|nr:UDP-glucose 4-epimerase GalE [Spirochaetota bacterium]